jgi:hypothetical protein
VLAPIVFNIAWFDAMLDPGALPIGAGLVGLEGFLVWQLRARFAPLLSSE